MPERQFTALIEKDEDAYVARCYELDLVTQGTSRAEAEDNLRRAVALFLEYASPEDISSRLSRECYISRLAASHGSL